MYLNRDLDAVEMARSEDLPLWRFAREIWDIQDKGGRLVLTENPIASEGLKLTFMQDRPHMFRAKVAQCQFGLKDVASGKPHRKLTALDVNSEKFAEFLMKGAKCFHQPDEHQPLEGKVLWQGQWHSRTTLAAAWPEKLCRHILQAARKTFAAGWSHIRAALHSEVGAGWEVAPARAGDTPDETVWREMAEIGDADRYGYVTFEGPGQAVPRRIRRAIAHLHVNVGHVNNDRLLRMLSLSGAGQQVMLAARHLHCEICARVQPPRDSPQVSGSRPASFNVRVSGDSFFVWDYEGKKFGVVHFIDALTDYQIADAAEYPTSKFTSRLLRNQWYGVFGPPDVLLTDGGREFLGVMETTNEIFGVQHEILPDGAKWRLGHAERHGAVLKIMIMKMVKSHTLKGLEDIRMAAGAAVAAKNRLTNNGGASPLQAVTGKQSLIPASLMTQICSGKMKFVVNQEIDREEALRKGERIRQAAVEAFMWVDAHQSLRRALASKSRPRGWSSSEKGAGVHL